ncbi:nitroreductase family protein [Falsirhodobacter sp. 20TX0035]|uniref:nitroreductase family protein n=1 Tax=Falsirhodobacter sp. 20TX0035 TaxID=3022019 RepID=UPI00232E74D6|nr:nitroreductase [Falsirhodobacter sp. 20TX0035]MDB6454427.1 nitroreductase [Falsirhodobacter sp. 20TX0035]
MPIPNTVAFEFLRTRRSRPPKSLTGPVPTRDDLRPLLDIAARTPDHGMLVPWRFLVIEPAAMPKLAALAEARADALGLDDEKRAKGRGQFDLGNLAVIVIASPKPSDKIPPMEQTLSAGAVCLSLVNAALATGWGAGWVTGWVSHDAGFAEGLGLAPEEWIAGIVHIGTDSATPPERPRPDIDAITTWIDA